MGAGAADFGGLVGAFHDRFSSELVLYSFSDRLAIQTHGRNAPGETRHYTKNSGASQRMLEFQPPDRGLTE
jgi:hypothetical protein